MEYIDPTVVDAVVTYHPETGTELALNLPMQARIQVVPMEVTR
jgi:hypothetical protein